MSLAIERVPRDSVRTAEGGRSNSEGQDMMFRYAAICLALAWSATLVGCRTGAGDVVGPSPAVYEGKNVTASRLAKVGALPDGQKSLILRVAETPGAQVHVVHTTEEIKPYLRKKHDQFFFVVSGRCISEVQGVRDVVGPGSVVVVPRGMKVRFLRGDQDVGKPLLMVRVSLPNDNVTDVVEVKVPKPKPKSD